MGALEFRPPITRAAPAASAVQMADLVLAARAAFDGSGDNAVDREALEQLIVVGSSAGGARPKALVAFNPATFQIRSAWRPLEAGFEHWLFKLDGVGGAALDGHSVTLNGGMAFGRIEYAYSQMALAAGITMTECRLLDEGPRRHFVTRRFDRGPAGEKHHIISLCGLAHLDFNLIGAHSYDQYLQTVRLLDLGPNELVEGFRRMVFNVAAANNDDHTRNLSFLRRPDSAWELAPAYDVTFAHDSANQWLRQHLMDVNGKVSGITAADLHAVGERHDVPGYRRIVREVALARVRRCRRGARRRYRPHHRRARRGTPGPMITASRTDRCNGPAPRR
jgi:serine/threonine-protein kinase HipA